MIRLPINLIAVVGAIALVLAIHGTLKRHARADLGPIPYAAQERAR